MSVAPARGGGHSRRLRLSRRVFLALVVLVIAGGAVKLSEPILAARRQQQELVRLRLERRALAVEQDRLQARKRGLASDVGQEAAARRAGYLRSGERRLVFVREEGSERGDSGSVANAPTSQVKGD